MQEDIIKDIRKRCRMAMNGIASTSMRNSGLNYKLNFGVSIQKIREIATRYQPNKELAETLWIDGTRELKILATLLYPTQEFTEQIANEWIEQIPNQEIREQIAVNLLQDLKFADKLGSEWSNNESDDIRTTGYWLLVRRILTKKIEVEINLHSFQHLWLDMVTENVSLRNATTLFLKNTGKLKAQLADQILEKVSIFKDSDDANLKELYDSLAFEFDFFYNN